MARDVLRDLVEHYMDQIAVLESDGARFDGSKLLTSGDVLSRLSAMLRATGAVAPASSGLIACAVARDGLPPKGTA